MCRKTTIISERVGEEKPRSKAPILWDRSPEEEVQELEQAFADRATEIEMMVLRQPSRDRNPPSEKNSLSDLYLAFKPHIFHFIGHGKIDKGDRKPYLFLYDKAYNKNVPWPLHRIIDDLGRHKPEFVFLNACHTVDAARSAESREAVWSLSDTFLTPIGIGARGVLGMHAAVKGDSAGKLAVAFYESILNGDDLDLALTAARNRIDQFKGHDPSRGWDWALPYLRVTVPPDQVLGMARVVRFLGQQIPNVNEFQKNCIFVNRMAERRDFLNRLQHDPTRSTNLLLVKGTAKVGKTDLIRCCLQSAATRGRLIKYVELDSIQKVDELGLLRLICEGEPRSLIEKPLPDRAMARFYQTLNALLDSADPADQLKLASYPTKPKWEINGKARKLPDNGGVQDQLEYLFAAFLEALDGVPHAAREDLAGKLKGIDDQAAERILADKRPYLIVIDQVSQRGVKVESFNTIMVPRLIDEFAKGIKANVMLVLAVAEKDSDALGLDNLGVATVPVNLSQFDPDDFERLAYQYFEKVSTLHPKYRQMRLDPEEWKSAVCQFAERYKRKRQNWNPDTLWSLLQITYFADSSEEEP